MEQSEANIRWDLMYKTTFRWTLVMILAISMFWACVLFFIFYLEPLMAQEPLIIPYPVIPKQPVPGGPRDVTAAIMEFVLWT